MTTLATLPALLAVALSLSSPSDYHYVTIPTNMAASLTGVGMGTEAPSSDAPLRYEDAAFLAEALDERMKIWGEQSGGYTDASPLTEKIGRPISSTLYDKYYKYISDQPLYSNVSYGYGDPDAELWGGIKDFTPGSKNYLAELTAIFSKPNWLELVDISYADVTNDTLRANYVASLYKYVSRATRPVMFGNLYSESFVSHCYLKDDDFRQYATTYDSIDGVWNYGDQDATNTVEKTEVGDDGFAPFSFAESVTYSVGRQKARGWKQVTDEKGNSEWKDVTGECDFYYTKMAKHSNRSAPVSFVFNLSTNVFAALGKRKATAGYLYATGTFTYKTTGIKENKAIDEKKFIMRLPESLYKTTMCGACHAGVGLPTQNDAIVAAVCSYFGVKPYGDAAAFLDAVPMPDETSSNHENYIQTSKTGSYTMSVSLDKFIAVYDIDFNARLPKEDE